MAARCGAPAHRHPWVRGWLMAQGSVFETGRDQHTSLRSGTSVTSHTSALLSSSSRVSHQPPSAARTHGAMEAPAGNARMVSGVGRSRRPGRA
eukprot:5892235-Heterocapsa_arctica.AAC.1